MLPTVGEPIGPRRERLALRERHHLVELVPVEQPYPAVRQHPHPASHLDDRRLQVAGQELDLSTG